jgi:hypothetical protein
MPDDAPIPESSKPPVARRAARPVWRPPPDAEVEELVADPPAGGEPPVLFWFRAFCLLVGVACVVVVGVGILAAGEAARYGAAVVGPALVTTAAVAVFAVFLVPMWVRTPQPWAWWYGLVLLLFAMLSVFLTVFALPLLAAWLTADVRVYFNRGTDPVPEAGT